MIFENELVVDNFAGGGGASKGMQQGIGRHVDIAINHDPAAIDMHKLNHPEAKHYCESVWDVDPVEACNGRRVGLGWFSPDCKHFSRAKGNVPINKNIRGLAWITIKWGALVPMRIFMLENVSEFLTWGEVSNGKPCPKTKGQYFEGFIKALSTGLPLGHCAYKDVYNALFRCNYDIKNKLKIFKAIKKGLGYDVDWKLLSACDFGAPTIRKRLFIVGRNDGSPIVWPDKTHGKEPGLLPYRVAADIIDWSIPVKSIFNRKKPLAENTLKRIAKGLQKFVFVDEPFIVPEQCAVPFLTEHANASSQRNMAIDEPLRTICAQVKGGHFAIVSSHMIKMRGTNIGHQTDEPVHTISAGGLHIGEVRAFLVKYYGTNFGHSCKQPLQTITTKDRFGIVEVRGDQYQIVDIGMRMLQPHELFAAQGFDNDYKFSHDSNGKKLSKANQVAKCGNSVCPPVAKALVIANIKEYELAA